ncbi:MAG: replication-associated recombination protein A [Chromatiales bacterium]|nr:replication-associated recombination protein A [Gammaproteobacteria bacterium]MBW6475846.1 replication-associated recombination protein A [Chromatiales bacterium]
MRPLADRMRPRNLDEFYGQRHLLAPGKPLRQAVESGQLHSMIFWGPPGTGKTTLSRMIASQADARFISLSAVLSGVKEIRAAVEQARQARSMGQGTVLFVDEVHRFNKAQQDAFLPHIEDGTFTFIGATTENPSFELNNALLSRARVYVLQALDSEAIDEILAAALQDPRGLADRPLVLDESLRKRIAQVADGDARRALNLLEVAADFAHQQAGQEIIDAQVLDAILSDGLRRFDKGGEAFYDQISALHKSVRGSDPDASLYWFARMIDGGVDPLYVARRVVRMASEDIGNADPRALQLALNAWDVQERLGSPEGELAIAQAIVYMACAAKSNAVYTAWNTVLAEVRSGSSDEVPVHLRNAPTKLMKELGYGHAYRYAHDEPDAYAAGENYFPETMTPRRYYQPVPRGLEQKIAEKLAHLRQLDAAALKNKK